MLIKSRYTGQMCDIVHHSYPVTIHHLYTSPGHNYFTHRNGEPGAHPTVDAAQVVLHANQGIVGDRFYGRGADFDGHVTFFSWEVYQLLRVEYLEMDIAPDLFRRNVIIEGIPLHELIGQEFTINGVRFRGAKHCAPCRWMDAAVTTGALAFLKGRGGLRTQVLSDGILRRGRTILSTAATLDLSACTARLPRPQLP